MLFRNSQRLHVAADLLSAYLDNQVTVAERDRIEGHLRACETCQREFDTLRQTVVLLRAMPRMPVPRAFTLSEVQVGIRRPVARPAWYGGALRGFAAVTAMVLVALVASTLLRRQTWTPGEMVALAPKPAQVATAAPAAAPAVAPAELAKTLVVEKAVAAPTSQEAAPLAEPEATDAVAEEAPLALAQAKEAQPPAPEAQPAPTSEAPATAVTPAPEPGLMAESKAMAALATPADLAAPTAADASAVGAATAPGRGGGMGAAGPTATEAEGLSAEAPPPAAPVASVLPTGAGVVYADQGSLWALDRPSGQRQVLTQTPDISSPLISDDGAWIAYRAQQADHMELWAVPWDGKEPRMVLDERALPAKDLPQGYRERRIQGMDWVPGQHRLAVITLAIPSEEGLPTEYELWNVDVQSGNIAYVTGMGQADRPFYAPEGKRFALLRNEGPDRGLWLFNADGSGARAALALPQGADGPAYDWQVRWLPDGAALWAAIPGPAAGGAQPQANISLHRVPISGGAEPIRTIEALDAYWSPEGSRLAYTRPISDSLETRELYLANADGSEPSLYATPRYWAFLGWAPDGEHFLYQDNQQVYLGTPGQPPQGLGNFLSIFDPHWIGADQFLHFLDQNASWVLVSRWLDGRAASLATLPRDAGYDVVPR